MSHPQDLSLREQAAAIAARRPRPRASCSRATLERIEERDGPLNSIVARFPEESERMLARGAARARCTACRSRSRTCSRCPGAGRATAAPREVLPAGESGVYRAAARRGRGDRRRHADALLGRRVDRPRVRLRPGRQRRGTPSTCGGGSSGGSASAVGARLVAGAVGTDGGGSIRLPAAYNGDHRAEDDVRHVRRTATRTRTRRWARSGRCAATPPTRGCSGRCCSAASWPPGDARGPARRAGARPVLGRRRPRGRRPLPRRARGDRLGDRASPSSPAPSTSRIATVLRLTLEGLPDTHRGRARRRRPADARRSSSTSCCCPPTC